MEEKKKIFIDLEKIPLSSEIEENKQKKKRRIFTVFLCFIFLILGILLTLLTLRYIFPKYGNSSSAINEVQYVMDNYWLYSKDYDDLNERLQDNALYGMSTFEDDPYTTYMSKKQQEEFFNTINMDYVGIGVEYSYYDNIAIVKKVFNDSPAMQAGILPGDIILQVDGKSIEGKTSDEIKQMVIGESGSKVVISVSRTGQKLDLTCTRKTVSNSVYGYVKDDCLILEISSFGESTAKECEAILDAHGDIDSLIIDLRDNSGGLQTSVRDICGLFIGDKKVYLKQSDVHGNSIDALTKASKTYDIDKIIVLINGNTASAAEVCAICLKQQHPNVTLVGQTSFGKGVIQSQKLLSNGGTLKFTSFYWYSPDGTSINKVGIKPDVEVRMDDIYYENYYAMLDDESYEYDSVSKYTKIAQLALKALDYDISRSDGYFDENFKVALNEFKVNNNLTDDCILDKQTYEAIVSKVVREVLNDEDHDIQLNKALELVK